jgi:K+-transporting ATPase ATPase C chain
VTRRPEPVAIVPREAPPPADIPGGYAPEPPTRRPSVRAAVGLLAVCLLLGCVAYPAAVTGFADVVSPSPATGDVWNGPNATTQASELIGQNISNSSLFWLRPSPSDWVAASGSGTTPYGPTDPELVNSTNQYIQEYGLTNTSVPLNLVSPSESGLDPDLTPEAALAQIPRIAFYTNLTQQFLTTFVEQHIQKPVFGFLGPEYVNVIELDIALIHLRGG